MTLRPLFVGAAALVALAAPLQAGTKAWTTDDILALKAVSDPRVSPDGRWVTYVVQGLNDDKSDYQNDLYVVPAGGGEARRLTTSPANDEHPRWSPDGRWIAFISERPRPGKKEEAAGKADADEAKRQIWLI